MSDDPDDDEIGYLIAAQDALLAERLELRAELAALRAAQADRNSISNECVEFTAMTMALIMRYGTRFDSDNQLDRREKLWNEDSDIGWPEESHMYYDDDNLERYVVGKDQWRLLAIFALAIGGGIDYPHIPSELMPLLARRPSGSASQQASISSSGSNAPAADPALVRALARFFAHDWERGQIYKHTAEAFGLVVELKPGSRGWHDLTDLGRAALAAAGEQP